MNNPCVKTLILFIAALFFFSCSSDTSGSLKHKIQKELDGSPFLKEKGIKLTVIKEENGYVTIEMVEGSRIIRIIIHEGVDIFDTQLGEKIAYRFESKYKDLMEGIHILRKSINYIKKMDGVKVVLLKAAINTPADQADDLFVKGMKLGKNKKYTEAFKCFQKAADYGDIRAQDRLGEYYASGLGVKKDFDKAIKYSRKVIERDNINGSYTLLAKVYAQNRLAWIYATSKDPKYRDGKKAVDLALKLCSQKPNDWSYNDTLAAAYARNGQFEKAIETQEKAIALLKQETKYSKSKKDEFFKEAFARLSLFNKNQAYVSED